jgi:hypothetical protein
MEQTLTRHAEARIWQRGLTEKDIDVVLRLGADTGDAVVLTNKVVDSQIAEYKRTIAQLERLRGAAVIVDGDAVLTAYRPRRWKMRRMLRSRACAVSVPATMPA